MSRNWQDIFQKGQGFSNQTIAQLEGLEVDVATALASNSGVGTLTQVLANGADANGVTITNLGAPSASTDASTKKYALNIAVAMGVAL